MRKLLFLVVVACHLAFAASALAHPLGNFTVNRFSRVEVAGDRVYVRYVVDLAEIPTFQLGAKRIDTSALARNLHLEIDGRRAALVPYARSVVHPNGAAGLKTTRLELLLRGPRIRSAAAVDYRDANYAGRIGWKEIVFGDAASRSRELRAYPRDLLRAPLDVVHARATLAPNGAAPPTLSRPAAAAQGGGGFASLVDDNLSPGVVLLALLLAMFWGAAHALSPGHGKAIVAAYLVGTRGTARHAALLGLVTTITHTIGVFGLGLVTLALSEFIVPETLYPWLNLASALLVVGVGVTVLRARYAHARAQSHGHDHHHHHDNELSVRGLVATGISGGILPCPTALVVLLAAISLHRVGYGLLLIVAFSLGLALSITAIGIVAVSAKSFFARSSFDGRLVRALPTVSALVVLALGAAMTLRALPKVM